MKIRIGDEDCYPIFPPNFAVFGGGGEQHLYVCKVL